VLDRSHRRFQVCGFRNGGGPTIANGMLYVNSDYGVFFRQPGNVLLAFSVEGK